MNGHSWPCLSVEEFFSRSNWQGQPLERPQGQRQELLPLASLQTEATETNGHSWPCLSVEEFFSRCNWQGRPFESLGGQDSSSPLAFLPAEVDSWPCLSVEEFFSRCNWQGQPLKSLHQQRPDQSLGLTLQVGEFFQFIPWEGKPEIGSLPKVLSMEEPITLGSVETTLTNLSELF